MFLAEKTDILKDFLAISRWESAVTILIFITLQISLWIFLKKIKLKFMYRVLIGLGIGLVYGLSLQAIIGFPDQNAYDGYENSSHNLYWVYELKVWAEFFSKIFINGVKLLTIPIVFIAMFKITAKPSSKNVGIITIKGIGLLLLNVAFAFVVTFALGMLTNVGKVEGLSVFDNNTNSEKGKSLVPLPSIIWGYLPDNFFSTMAASSIIPVMVVGALAGLSVKILSKRKSVEMEAVRKAMDTGWDIIISILMTFMKFMPLAVMSMITVSIVTRPIGMLAVIGKVIGVGYLGILISIGWLTLLIFLSGMKVSGWWKSAWRPLIQGFATQSSNATLPVTIDTIKNDLKVGEVAANTIGPISTTMGLIACAGVQAGLATSILWTGTDSSSVVHEMGFIGFFLISLLVTIIASLGIAGVPGTATVVTVGVIGGIGFPGFTDSVLAFIAPLDGLFDMGRTGANVLGAVAVAPIVAKSEGLIEQDSPLLGYKGILKQNLILSKKKTKEAYIENLQNIKKTYATKVSDKEITKDLKEQYNLEKLEALKELENSYNVDRANLKEAFIDQIASYKKGENIE